MEKVKPERDSRFELLRIIAMLMIVFHHFAVHGFEIGQNWYFSNNRIIIYFLGMGGKIGVNLFILISSYFMIDSKFTFRKILKIVGETLFYSIGIILLLEFVLQLNITFRPNVIIKSLFPITLGQYWFVTNYIILMLISPYLNIIINNLDKKSFKKMLIYMLIFTVAIAGIFPNTLTDIATIFVWFMVLYLIAGYIKKHFDLSKISFVQCILVTLSSIMLLFWIICSLDNFNFSYKVTYILEEYYNFYIRENSIFVMLSSMAIFLFFLKLPKKSNKFINKIASATLGVYLIHDNIYMRKYLWHDLLNTQDKFFSVDFLAYSVVIVIIVYIACTIIDLIRQATIEKIYLKIIDKFYNIYEMRKNMPKEEKELEKVAK